MGTFISQGILVDADSEYTPGVTSKGGIAFVDLDPPNGRLAIQSSDADALIRLADALYTAAGELAAANLVEAVS